MMVTDNETDMLNLDFLAVGEVQEGNGNYEPLEDGVYSGCLAAITVREMKKYQSEETEPKITLTFQIVDVTEDENGKEVETIHYVRSAPFRNANNEKSTMVALVGGWLKKAPADLTGLNLRALLGKPAQVVVKQEVKGDKTYVRLESLLPVRKNDKTTLKQDMMPYFIVKGAIQKVLAPGMGVKTPSEEELKNAPKPTPAPAAAPAAPAVPAVGQPIDAASYFGMAPAASGVANSGKVTAQAAPTADDDLEAEMPF